MFSSQLKHTFIDPQIRMNINYLVKNNANIANDNVCPLIACNRTTNPK